MDKYRIVEYKNGHGRKFYRIQKMLWILPIWVTIKSYSYYTTTPKEFHSCEDAKDWIDSEIHERNNDRRRKKRVKLRIMTTCDEITLIKD